MRAEMSKGAERPDTGTGPAFRVATEADTEALVELLNSAYRGETSRKGWTTEAHLLGGQRVDPEGVAETLTAPDTRIVLAEVADRLVACCELQRGGDGDAYFGMFAVRPDEQGGGLGSLLLAEAERMAGEWGCERLRMVVIRQRADLIAWYERRGYRRTGVEAPFPYGDPRYGLPKRSDLVFDELVKPMGAERHDDRAPA
ncbi:GNAT superfamily N-acetyltransferase [Lipingzhangella halophila]|uniref:GNAT superfamily N-acetyltransferase n=1 Tax=Lipingzhangella halophila TaxID=1783352 RepID=A0A7W7W0Z9_9ACTN|nr:GNAT family N-acetyltransferase [Lipingzhangella halophila]MBB4930447.1 GNAT superfamily N-acetyltransferase [Lipingzhangella halophila]